MSTTSDLLERITDPANLAAAWSRVHAHGAAGGSDGVSVAAFAASADRELEALRGELLGERYVPAPLLACPIRKASGGERVLHLPAVRDKIAQQAARQVLEPALDASFLDCSYGYRPGKGPARAIARVTHYLTSMKRGWVAAGDVDECFDSIDQARVERTLARLIGDARVVRLFALWSRMGTVTRGGRWRDAEGGVHQGNVVAPLLANVYLHAFDEALVRAGIGLVRYADDFVLPCRTRDEAERAAETARQVLETALALRLNDGGCAVHDVARGFTFLGIRFEGRERSLDPRKLDAARQRLAALDDTVSRGLGAAVAALAPMAAGWRRYYGALLDAAALAPLQLVIDDALARYAALARAAHSLSRADVERALLVAEPVLDTGPNGQRERARRIAAMCDGDAPARVVSAARADARSSGAPARTTTAAAVRARKRQHLANAESSASLLVNAPGAFVGKALHAVVVRRERRETARIPVSRLRSIVVASRGVSLSEDAIDLCAQRGVPVVFVSPWGEVRAVAAAAATHDAELVTRQCAAAADPERAGAVARDFVCGKVRNQLALAKYWGKYHRGACAEYSARLDALLEVAREVLRDLGDDRRRRSAHPDTLDARRARLMGAEGRVAAAYWPLVGCVLRGRHPFAGRERRGAQDLVNCLLNYGYAVLQSRVHVALVQAGLLPAVGFLHAARRKAPTLAFDLMEEFRAPVVDRAVVTLLTRRRPVGQDPQRLLTRDARALVVDAVTRRMGALIRHRGREATLGEVIELQARRLAHGLLTGERYRPYLARW